MTHKIAVIGATGNVGRVMLQVLAENKFLHHNIFALASKKSIGKKVSYGDQILVVQNLEDFNFEGVDIALFAVGSKISKEYGPKAINANCIIIDNSSHFRMDPDVPLIIPEVNAKDLEGFNKKRIIANPNCNVIQLAVALKPLHDYAKIKRIVVSTYQSVSGAGKSAMDELYLHTKAQYMNQKMSPINFEKSIVFNVIPHIDDFLEDGYTKEEQKVELELQKILSKDIKVTATCVRVPVFIGHSIAVNIEFENEISVDEARDILSEAPGILILDRPEEEIYVTPIDCVGDDVVYVSRIRKDSSIKNALNIWVVSDNLRKGAALNAVQTLIELINKYL